MEDRTRIFRTVTVHIPIRVHGELERKARAHGISVEELVTLLVRRHVGARGSDTAAGQT